jgi:DNA-binding MurR/RpiR family transcriptional regulator
MTVRATIMQVAPRLTASERKLANAILADYPFTGLQQIQELAARTGVSAPSITRFVSKVGFGGYHEFQRQLIAELKESRRSPLDLMSEESGIQESDFLGDYAQRLADLLTTLSSTVPPGQFEAVCRLIADPSRNVFVLGGRISDSIARFLSTHLQQIRPKVFHLAQNSELWPEDILRMRKQDVLVLFDVRRYQPDLARLATLVRERRKASIVLVTDKWMSPIARDGDIVVPLSIGAGTAWDTVVCLLAFVEALIVKVSESNWPATKARIEEWDALRLARPDEVQGQGKSDEA